MGLVFSAAVKAGKMKADVVLRENGGGMEDLLHSLLACNDDRPKSGFSSLSDQAYRLGQEVRKSDEWLVLAKAIALSASEFHRAQRIRDAAEALDRLRSNTYQAEPSPVENNGKTTQTLDDAVAKFGDVVTAVGGSTGGGVGPARKGRPGWISAARGYGVKGHKTKAEIIAAIGQNIQKLRKECGWSLEKLADVTGIDKKLVLSHVHGKHKPIPKTLKKYAQAFAKELNRPITANNLEE